MGRKAGPPTRVLRVSESVGTELDALRAMERGTAREHFDRYVLPVLRRVVARKRKANDRRAK